MNMRCGFRSVLVSSSLVVVTFCSGQRALAQTDFPTPVPASTMPSAEQIPETAQPSQTFGQLPHLSQPESTNFFRATLNDFKNLGSKQTLGWLAIGALAATATHPADLRVTTTVSGAPMMQQVRSGNTIGGKEFQLGASLGAFTIGKLTGHDRVADVAGKVLRAQIVSQTLTHAIKFTAQRTRPDGSNARSFPSGHTSISFASATVLQRELGWKVGIPAYAVAAYVGAARIQDRKHFLSDVAMGAAIGILAGRTVTIGSGEKKFAVSPVATRGGAAVNFSWVGSGKTP
jgi:membrane-associated phospholipid phosphatase